MKLTVAESAGFCFGVSRSVDLAEKVLAEKGRAVSLGELIHNEDVVLSLKLKGLKVVDDISEISADDDVLVRAHGISKAQYEALEATGANVVDATCPKVTAIHKIVSKASDAGRFVVIIGMRNHPEVEAISGWCDNSVIFEDVCETAKFIASHEDISSLPVTVVSQTTQTHDNFNKCVDLLKKMCTNIEIFDTICLATFTRQAEALKLAESCDSVIVIGGKHSANSIHLAQLCAQKCGNVQFIERASELNLRQLSDCGTVGLTAGASTPSWIIKEVVNKMDEIKVAETEIQEAAAAAEETVKAVEENVSEAVSAAAEEVKEVAEEVKEAAKEAVEDAKEAAEEVKEEVKEEIKAEVTPAGEMSFDMMLEDSLRPIYNGDKVTGIVTAITGTEVTVDLGTKYTGFIPSEEFAPNGEKITDVVKIGDEVEAIVVRVNDVEGTAGLSKKRLDNAKFWEQVESASSNGEVVEGVVAEENKGGVVVNVKGIRVFVPASQTDLPRDADLAQLLKKNVKLKITEVNKARKRVVGSIKRAASAERSAMREKIWEEIEEGKKFKGVVKSLTNYGAFVDIGGIDGMVHVSELTWGRIKHPSEVVNVGDEVDVYVLGFDKENRRISLGYKDPEANPWDQFKAKYAVGDEADVKIVKLMPFGAFAELVPGVDGLIHISQLANHRVEKAEDAVKVGDVVTAKITAVDDDKHKVSLSIRALLAPEEAKEGVAEAEAEAEAVAEDAAEAVEAVAEQVAEAAEIAEEANAELN